ncbi:MAG TPA: leucyl aminopeptidase [Blastocatellia bacterium]|nr:leucyl aminopeptidase [Blastocatellia bacterium]
MKVIASHTRLNEINDDVLIVPVFEGETSLDPQGAPALASLDHLTRGMLEAVFQSGEMSGKSGRWTLLHTPGNLSTRRLLLYGAGRRERLTTLALQRVAGGATRLLDGRGMRTAAFLLRENMTDELNVRAVVEGVILGEVKGDLYRAKDDATSAIETLHLVTEHPEAAAVEPAIAVATTLAEATNFARTLGFEPGNIMTPTELANRAEAMAAREGLSFEALDEDEMKQLGMGALLAVSRGSQEPARLIVMRYEPAGAAPDELIALVGKGITFDSGGISIKPAEHMEEMKYDMGGGAAVIGAMQAIARLKPGVRVIGVVPASENLPSGRAVKPGDVVRSLSGKTIEVANTDAEGRLILADAITYSIQQGATTLVDVATLTGACVIALGGNRAAVMSNRQSLADELIVAGEQSGERLWPMPLDKEYGDMIRSDIADIRNIGNRVAGAITAAWFLKHFAGETPWAHLDIAGTAWTESVKPYLAKGATGFGVRLLTNFVRGRARQ